MKETKKLQLKESMLLSLEELKNVLGAGNGQQGPEVIVGCGNFCSVTCALYLHM